MPYKAGIFDIGNVLQIQDVNGPLGDDVAKTFGISREIFEKFRKETELLLLRGKITEQEYWEMFVRKNRIKTPIPDESLLLREYRKHFSVNKEVLEIIQQLKKNGVRLACLTDTQEPHTKFNTKMGLYDEFEVKIFSHDIGTTKPDLLPYKFTVEKLGVTPSETFFVDDKEENLVPARTLGITTILFKTPLQLRIDLKGLGLLRA